MIIYFEFCYHLFAIKYTFLLSVLVSKQKKKFIKKHATIVFGQNNAARPFIRQKLVSINVATSYNVQNLFKNTC